MSDDLAPLPVLVPGRSPGEVMVYHRADQEVLAMHENIAKSQYEVPAQEATKRTTIQANAALKMCKWILWSLVLTVVGVMVRPEAWQAWAAAFGCLGAVGGIALFRVPKALLEE